MTHIYDENGYCFECDNRQQMNEVIKLRGIKSVKEVTGIIEQSPQTLKNWYLHKPELFDVVLKGVLVVKNE